MLLRMIRAGASRSSVWVRASASAAVETMRQTAYVRYKEGSDSLTITLELAGRQRNMQRPVDEPLERPFSRIRANLVPAKQDKRAKKKKPNAPGGAGEVQEPAAPQAPQELFIGLFRDEDGRDPIDASTPNGEAWPAAALLRVGPESFRVQLNPPTVESLGLPGFPMVGFPILPVLRLAFADGAQTRWRWLRQRPAAGGGAARQGGGGGGGWEDTGCASAVYTPTERDLGCLLRVEATPAAGGGGGAAGEPSSATAGPVLTAPEQTAARLRQLAPGVPLAEPWRFRVMSYNILADQYAGTSYAQQVLFGYCPTHLLDNNYRRQLVLEEIQRYQPDIACLQEVDDKVFAEFLEPHLALAGFSGHYTNKQGRVREGSAVFWRRDKWACAAVQDVRLREVFKPPLSGRHAQFAEMLGSSPALVEALQMVTTVAQLVLLVPRGAAGEVEGEGAAGARRPPGGAVGVAEGEPAPVVVANTHLFFHPYAPHIRSLHTAAILEEAAASMDAWGREARAPRPRREGPAGGAAEPGALAALARLPPPTLLFCGDLNSDLNDGVPGVVEMLQTGRLAADHWDWQMGASFRWGKEEDEYTAEEQQQQQQQQQHPEQPPPPADGHDFDPPSSSPRAAVPVVAGADVRVPFALRSADDLATPYTNYTSGYKALLDYVWYDPGRLHVVRQLPAPAEALLAGFIPSAAFPSDHLAVVYDLAFRPPPRQQEQQQQQQQQQEEEEAGARGGGGRGLAAGDGGRGLAAGGGGAARRHDPASFVLLPASEDHVGDAAAALARGEVVALPTDTLYGLAAAAGSAAAVAQLRRVKRRAPAAPFAVAVADVAAASAYCQTEGLPEGLLAALLPGPVTVLLPLRPGAPLAPGVLHDSEQQQQQQQQQPAAAGGPAGAPPQLVGVRVVPSEFVRAVCRRLGGALALTSANPSGGESSLCVQDFRELWQYCGAVFDGGRVPVAGNEGSTVVDLSGALGGGGGGQGPGGFRIVRAGVAAESASELLAKSFGLRRLG